MDDNTALQRFLDADSFLLLKFTMTCDFWKAFEDFFLPIDYALGTGDMASEGLLFVAFLSDLPAFSKLSNVPE